MGVWLRRPYNSMWSSIDCPSPISTAKMRSPVVAEPGNSTLSGRTLRTGPPSSHSAKASLKAVISILSGLSVSIGRIFCVSLFQVPILRLHSRNTEYGGSIPQRSCPPVSLARQRLKHQSPVCRMECVIRSSTASQTPRGFGHRFGQKPSFSVDPFAILPGRQKTRFLCGPNL